MFLCYKTYKKIKYSQIILELKTSPIYILTHFPTLCKSAATISSFQQPLAILISNILGKLTFLMYTTLQRWLLMPKI